MLNRRERRWRQDWPSDWPSIVSTTRLSWAEVAWENPTNSSRWVSRAAPMRISRPTTSREPVGTDFEGHHRAPNYRMDVVLDLCLDWQFLLTSYGGRLWSFAFPLSLGRPNMSHVNWAHHQPTTTIFQASSLYLPRLQPAKGGNISIYLFRYCPVVNGESPTQQYPAAPAPKLNRPKRHQSNDGRRPTTLLPTL